MYTTIELAFFVAWWTWTLWFNLKYNKLIEALVKKADPERQFVWRQTGVFNRYYLHRCHPKATAEFLEQWDKVYGKFWRLFIFYTICWFIGGGVVLFLLRILLSLSFR
jgi:hypothetical protein